ncbi:MAG: T9SS type A sorting domain-containing protein [Bacteroidales bacterium]
MKKFLLLLLAVSMSPFMMGQPLAGIKTIDPAGSGADNYVSFALAIADLNLNGVGTGGVIFNVASGAVFSEAPLTISTTGTLGNPVIFQKSGVERPVIKFTGTAATNEACFQLSACDFMTIDGLDIRDAGTASSNYMEYGFYLIGTSGNGCKNNIIQNCVIDMTKTNVNARGIYLSSLATSIAGTNSLNLLYNNDVKDCNSGYYLNGNATYPDDGNEIGTSGIGTSSITNVFIYGTYCNFQANLKIFNTSISNFTGSGALYGLYFLGNGSTADIFNNNIYAISSSGGTVNGIFVSNTATFNIYRNKVYDLSYTGVSNLIVSGIHSNAGPALKIYNNFVYDIKNTKGTGVPGARGLSLAGGTTLSIFNNTVYLDYVSTFATNKSAALYTAFTVTSVDLRNNIFVNNVTGVAGAKAYCIYKNGTSAFANLAAASNNNLYYAGTPGPDHLIYSDNGTVNFDTTLAQYQARVTPRENHSVTELPPFVSSVSPYDLHLNMTKTQCESGGIVVSTPFPITADFDENPRYPNAGFPDNPGYHPTAPDIGADEFAGLFKDVNPPLVSYIPVANTNLLTSRLITATMTDFSGIPTTGNGVPQLYYNVNSGAYSGIAGNYIGDNQFSFQINATVVIGDVVSYYFVARDSSTNVGVTPGIGATGLSFDPPACSTPPTAPYSYMILGDISGVFHVGIGKDYENLQFAVYDLNSKFMTGPVTFILDDNTYPPLGEQLTIKNNPGSSIANILTIKPNTGITPTIWGAFNYGSLVRVLNSNTIIDGSNNGGTSRDLTITNTGDFSPSGILFGSSGTTPITNSSIMNTVVTFTPGLLTFTPEKAISVSDSTAGIAGYFNNITIQNNDLKTCGNGVTCTAVAATGNGTGLAVKNNKLDNTGDNAIANYAISIQGVDGATVANNNIGQMGTGIYLLTVKNSIISDNTITNLGSTTGAAMGIYYTASIPNANVNITGNTIAHLTSGGSPSYGCLVSGSGVIIQKNNIFDIKDISPNVFISAAGIGLSSSLSNAGNIVVNNLISDVTTFGHPSLTDWNGYGIKIMGGGGYGIYFNTVSLPTNQTYTDGDPACLFISSSVTAPGSIDVRNNIFSISATSGTNRYAVLCNAANTVFSSLDYNDYYTSGPSLGYIGGADRSDLAAWKTGTGLDVNSQSIDPAFVSTTDLHPTAAMLNNLGTWMTAYPADYAGVSHTNPPDMGAYTFGASPEVITTGATNVNGTSASVNGTINPGNETVNIYFDYGLSSAYGTTVSGTPPTVSGISAYPVTAAITGLAESTTYHFRLRGVANPSGTFYGNDMTFTTGAGLPGNLAVINTISSDTCFNATNTITVAGTPNTFVVTPAGSVTMIAGVNILYLPGTTVQPGGYLHGYISTGSYCGAAASPAMANITGQDETLFNTDQANFTIYPNPTTGNFTLVQKGDNLYGNVTVEVFSMRGEKVMTEMIIGEKMHDFRFSEMATGLYFVKVVADGYVETMKLIKQ